MERHPRALPGVSSRRTGFAQREDRGHTHGSLNERSSPMDRTVETIRADWRAATDQRKDLTFNPDLEARIEVLRLEHDAAFAERLCEIQETRARRARVH